MIAKPENAFMVKIADDEYEVTQAGQQDLFETEVNDLLLDQFEADRLYTRSKDYKDLLDFVVRLQAQKHSMPLFR